MPGQLPSAQPSEYGWAADQSEPEDWSERLEAMQPADWSPTGSATDVERDDLSEVEDPSFESSFTTDFDQVDELSAASEESADRFEVPSFSDPEPHDPLFEFAPSSHREPQDPSFESGIGASHDGIVDLASFRHEGAADAGSLETPATETPSLPATGGPSLHEAEIPAESSDEPFSTSAATLAYWAKVAAGESTESEGSPVAPDEVAEPAAFSPFSEENASSISSEEPVLQAGNPDEPFGTSAATLAYWAQAAAGESGEPVEAVEIGSEESITPAGFEAGSEPELHDHSSEPPTAEQDDGDEEADAPFEPAALVVPVVAAVAELAEPPSTTKSKGSGKRRKKSKDKKSKGAPEAPSAKDHDGQPIKKIVGLRVGSSQLSAARVHNNGTAEVVQIARAPLGRGIVSGGEVRDQAGLTRALKEFFSENKLPRRGIRLGIASNRIGVRVLDVPAIEDPRLFENSIRFHAQETLPIPVTDAILDHVILGEGEGQGLEPTTRVLLVFAHRELVDRHVEACRRAGLKLDGIDFEAFALLRALGTRTPEDTDATQATVAVAVGHERTIFAVSDGKVCDFTRVLEWGGGSLDVAIARQLDLTPSQAEPIKLAISLGDESDVDGLSHEQTQAARTAILTELQTLSRELVSSLQYYQSRPDSLDIGEIILTGGGAQLNGFASEIERLIGVPVEIGDPFGRVVLSRKVQRPTEPGSLAVAVGLGIED